MRKERHARRGPSRLPAAGGMLALAVGLVAFSGWWYTAARQPQLTTHPATVAVADAVARAAVVPWT